jgi:hypothetical protein
MRDLFQSPKQRVGRAKHHIRTLKSRITKFRKKEPYTRVIETDTDGVTQLHKIKLTRKLPDSFTHNVVEVVEALRSALDQAASATAIASGIPEPRSSYFPIAGTASDLENVIQGNCKDVPPDIVTLFRTFQPYKGGNDLIWALNRFRNINIHRVLVPVGTASGGIQARAGVLQAGPNSSVGILTPRWDGEKDEMIFARVGPGSNIQYDFKFAFFVAFGDIEIIGGQPAIPVLEKMAAEVEKIILSTETESKRIGLIT